MTCSPWGKPWDCALSVGTTTSTDNLCRRLDVGLDLGLVEGLGGFDISLVRLRWERFLLHFGGAAIKSLQALRSTLWFGGNCPLPC